MIGWIIGLIVALVVFEDDNKSPLQPIENLIYVICGQQVMLDSDLANLYGVETRRLNEQVKRNAERFPEDFMFQLSKEEAQNLMSQFATSSSRSQIVILNEDSTNLKSQNATSSWGGKTFMTASL